MLLCVDIGNSNILFGVYKDNELLDTFRIESNLSRTEDEFAAVIITCLANFDIDYHDIDGVIISSVILSINPIFEKVFSKYFNVKAMFVNNNLKSGIAIKIDQPKTLAPDILIGAVGAKQKFDDNCLVIDVGTATTLTIVTKNNEYIGGLICPGLKSSANSLVESTAVLPAFDLEIPDHVICKETIPALQAGLMYGYACMVNGLVDKLIAEFNDDLKIIITGGLAEKLMPLLQKEIILDDNLLLDGLNYLYHKNKK